MNDKNTVWVDAGHLREILDGDQMLAYCQSMPSHGLVPLRIVTQPARLSDAQAEVIAATVYSTHVVDSTASAFQQDWALVRAGYDAGTLAASNAAEPAGVQHAPGEWWYDLAQRHANRNWNSAGYLDAVKALVNDALATPPHAAAVPASPWLIELDSRLRMAESHNGGKIDAASVRECIEKGPAVPAGLSDAPDRRGVYAWVTQDGHASLVHVGKRPTAHCEGGKLNAVVIESSKFYDGCAVEQWGKQGRWVLLHDFDAALAAGSEPSQDAADGARYRWLRDRLSGRALREAGVIYSTGHDGIDKAIDAASTQTSSQDAPRAVPAGLSDAQIERAAEVLADCMDYPWSHMPEKGKGTMRRHAKSVIDASLAASAPGAPDLAQPQQGTGSGD